MSMYRNEDIFPRTVTVAQRMSFTVPTMTFTATPVFDASVSSVFYMTLTGNVTSSTLTNLTAGQEVTFVLTQDATGGRTFAWPSNVYGGTALPGAAGATLSLKFFSPDGKSVYPSYAGKTEFQDITIGAAADGVTDDFAVLQANINAAAGGVPFIPPNVTVATSQTLVLPINTGLYISAGSWIKCIATITGHGVVETASTRTTNPEIWGGGGIDANGKADYCFWAHNFAGIRIHDITVKGSNVYGLYLGDGGSSFSDNAWVQRCWIDRPGAVSIPASSAGIHTTNCGDSDIGSNTIISYDIGIDINGSNNMLHENHAWARLAFTQAFNDTGTGNIWMNNYADGPATYGYHFTSSANNFVVMGGKVYNGSTSVDNVLTGILIANAAPVGVIHGVFFWGFSGTNRINKDINSLSGYTNISLSGNMTLNTTTVNSQAVTLQSGTFATATAGAATLPANPVGFVEINLAGSLFKVPYYNV